MIEKIKFTYFKTPLSRYTFSNKRIKTWVESRVEGEVLNLFAGKTRLNCKETRVDSNPEMDAHFYCDALEYCKLAFEKEHAQYGTVLLDLPYAYRKSMEMYDGNVMSPFNALKDAVVPILLDDGLVITFGYHSVSMGIKRGFTQEEILLMSHGGAIHDTIAVVERLKHRKKKGIFK